MTADEAALLAAIESHPGEDTPRLALADHYDELGEPQKACDQRLAVLLRAIRAAPDDDGPRLAYAAVGEQYGWGERAQFIRAQIECWRMSGDPSLDVRREEVRRRLMSLLEGDVIERMFGTPDWSWSGDEMDTLITTYTWPGGRRATEQFVFSVRRGFAEEVTCRAADWLAHADAVLARHPVREVRVPIDRAFADAVGALWAERIGRGPVGMLLSEMFRDLWGCELFPMGHAAAGEAVRDNLAATHTA